MLAAAMGALVIVAVLGVFALMDRTNAEAARRFDESTMISRLHLVMRRVWGELVINDQATAGAGATSGARGATGSTGRSSFVAAQNVRNGEAEQPPRPRVLLDVDASPALKAGMKNSGMSGAVQRLEVLLNRPPVPADYGGSMSADLQASLQASGAMATRYVFELRPDHATPPSRLEPGERIDPNSSGLTLWGRQLPALEKMMEPDPYLLDPTEDPAAVRLATGLQECNWEVFMTQKDENGKAISRERTPVLSAETLEDLPAYAIMKLRTASGMTADWMFEVGWSFGPETLDQAGQSTEQEGNNAGQGGPGGGRGGQGGGGGGRGSGGGRGPGMGGGRNGLASDGGGRPR